MSFSVKLGQRIAQMRKNLSITQIELAEKAGLGHAQTVSQIEKGCREVKAHEISSIARVLHSTISHLVDVEPVVRNEVLWRGKPDHKCKRLELMFLEKCHQYLKVETVGFSGTFPRLPSIAEDLQTMTFERVHLLAEDIGRIMQLGDRPACCLQQILENRYGVKIFFKSLTEGSALSAKGDFGYAMLINSEEPPWRRNYNVAHELFHLITWQPEVMDRMTRDSVFEKRVETLANVFASSLLLPCQSLRESIELLIIDNTLTKGDLIALARNYSVSSDALIWRLVNLRYLTREAAEQILSDTQFRESDRRFPRVDWYQIPPVPERFVRLGYMAMEKGEISRSLLARYLEVNIADLSKRLLEYGFDEKTNTTTSLPVA